MKPFETTLTQAKQIITEYGSAAIPDGKVLERWKRELFMCNAYLLEEKNKYRDQKNFLFESYKNPGEGKKPLSDTNAKNKAELAVKEYRYLDDYTGFIQNVCISIQQDIKTRQELIKSNKYDGQT